MSEYYLPDITGVNADYLKVNFPFGLYAAGMKLVFEASPIFASSLNLVLTDGTMLPLIKDTDWEIKGDDIDHSAMSRAWLEDSNFNELLVKSVTLKSTTHVGKRVAASFQQFCLTDPGRVADDGRPIEFSPDVLKSLISSVAHVQQQVTHVNSPVVTNLSPPVLLPFDINKERPGNFISNEPAIVNTVASAKVIRLVQGAFFADSVEIRQNGNPLVKDTDYQPIRLSSLTDKSTNVGGIYQYILINKSLSGTLTVDYHAVGGEVQPTDINSVYDMMTAIAAFLNDSTFITSDTVQETTAFRALNARTNLLEDGMRRLLTGAPTYGETSPNNAVTRPISSVDAGFHWWTIASLYQVEGSTDIIRADQFKARVYLPDSKISLAFSLDVNFDQDRNRASFKTDTLIFDPKYTLFSDADVAAPQYPLVRVVWNESAQSYSGALIQIGVPLPALVDRMVVEDLSTPESCWILSREHEAVIGQIPTEYSAASDSGFTLPDGISVWASSSSISQKEVFVPSYDQGYLLYSGAGISIANLISDFSTSSLFSVALPTYFPISRVKRLIVTMMSLDSLKVYDIEIPLTGTVDNTRSGRSTFADSDLTTMNMLAQLNQAVGGDITISLNISEAAYPLITNSPSDKTDYIKYVRVIV